jgi:hypothetical protein
MWKAQNQFLSVNKQLSGASISSENEIEISKMLTEAKKIHNIVPVDLVTPKAFQWYVCVNLMRFCSRRAHCICDWRKL